MASAHSRRDFLGFLCGFIVIMAALEDRFRTAFRNLLNEFFPERRFLGLHRYSVVSCDYEAQTFDGQPSVSKYGLPAVSKVPIRSSLKIDLKPGTSVLLGFESADPAAPFLAHADQLTVMGKAKLRADDQIEIGEAAQLQACRQGDMVIIPMQGIQMSFATAPAGDTGPPNPPPSQMMTMIPYFVSVNLGPGIPPVFPSLGSLTGVTASGSGLVKVA